MTHTTEHLTIDISHIDRTAPVADVSDELIAAYFAVHPGDDTDAAVEWSETILFRDGYLL